MVLEKLVVPDIGDDTPVEVIEVLIKKGQAVEQEETLIVLESDKATMEIPSDKEGVIEKVLVKKGDKLKTGDVIADLKINQSAQKNPSEPEASVEPEHTSQSGQTIDIILPDLGTDESVTVIEILVTVGQSLEKDDSILTLESDKASMDVPISESGVVKEVLVKKGDLVKAGDKVGTLALTTSSLGVKAEKDKVAVTAPVEETVNKELPQPSNTTAGTTSTTVYAGPAARKIARQLGVDISKCTGTGKNSRVLVEDVTAYAKSLLENKGSQSSLPSRKVPDFSKYGEISFKDMSRIKQKTAQNLQATNMIVPQVTQFDKADITDLEKFRQQNKKMVADQGGKLTMILFVMKSLVAAMKKYPQFNSSLSECGTQVIQKHYFHVGVAVDTPNGLVVPVVQNVDTKSIIDLAQELVEISQLARKGQLKASQMQGASMTISSLGGIGGTAFTPIVNWPDVAILGLSAIQIEPLWNGSSFEPRQILPLSLSYDHRVIDGAEAARFIVELKQNLEDMRRVFFS